MWAVPVLCSDMLLNLQLHLSGVRGLNIFGNNHIPPIATCQVLVGWMLFWRASGAPGGHLPSARGQSSTLERLIQGLSSGELLWRELSVTHQVLGNKALL